MWALAFVSVHAVVIIMIIKCECKGIKGKVIERILKRQHPGGHIKMIAGDKVLKKKKKKRKTTDEQTVWLLIRIGKRSCVLVPDCPPL